ncbi:MAG: fluoride efflux transporter CrcB [Gammaproteobacteria bacterium]|jgi:CrcB protein
MVNILFIAGGGALGALLRYWMSTQMHNIFGRDFPYGTLSVNVIGSVAIGMLYVVSVERFTANVELRAGLMIGLLGAFTTFSSFSLETLTLIQSGQQFKAVLNVILSVTLCLIGCWVGMAMGKQI